MKLRFALAVLLSAIASPARSDRIDPLQWNVIKIDPGKPPEGVHIVQILLENQSLPLKGTHCGSGFPDDNRMLQHQIALTLGYAITDKRHLALVSGGCRADKFELKSGDLIDGWRCNIGVVEKTKNGKFVSSSQIDFGVKRDSWELIPEALRCM